MSFNKTVGIWSHVASYVEPAWRTFYSLKHSRKLKFHLLGLNTFKDGNNSLDFPIECSWYQVYYREIPALVHKLHIYDHFEIYPRIKRRKDIWKIGQFNRILPFFKSWLYSLRSRIFQGGGKRKSFAK